MSRSPRSLARPMIETTSGARASGKIVTMSMRTPYSPRRARPASLRLAGPRPAGPGAAEPAHHFGDRAQLLVRGRPDSQADDLEDVETVLGERREVLTLDGNLSAAQLLGAGDVVDPRYCEQYATSVRPGGGDLHGFDVAVAHEKGRAHPREALREIRLEPHPP